jgi:hypothetical protein
MIILGIDPGWKGAFFVLQDGLPVEDLVMPIINIEQKNKTKHELDETKVLEFVKRMKPDHVYLEKAQAMAKFDAVSGKMKIEGRAAGIFNYGCAYGIIRGLLSASGFAYTLVHPRTWQAKVFKDLNKQDTKAMAYVVCQRLFPRWSFMATERCRKPHEGLTDAALITYYGYLEMQGITK